MRKCLKLEFNHMLTPFCFHAPTLFSIVSVLCVSAIYASLDSNGPFYTQRRKWDATVHKIWPGKDFEAGLVVHDTAMWPMFMYVVMSTHPNALLAKSIVNYRVNQAREEMNRNDDPDEPDDSDTYWDMAERHFVEGFTRLADYMAEE